jgi:hypothetical protein
VHPVNVKANSRAMILIRTVYRNPRLLSDFLLLSPSSLKAANVRCFLIDRQSPPNDPAHRRRDRIQSALEIVRDRSFCNAIAAAGSRDRQRPADEF